MLRFLQLWMMYPQEDNEYTAARIDGMRCALRAANGAVPPDAEERARVRRLLEERNSNGTES